MLQFLSAGSHGWTGSTDGGITDAQLAVLSQRDGFKELDSVLTARRDDVRRSGITDGQTGNGFWIEEQVFPEGFVQGSSQKLSRDHEGMADFSGLDSTVGDHQSGDHTQTGVGDVKGLGVEPQRRTDVGGQTRFNQVLKLITHLRYRARNHKIDVIHGNARPLNGLL